MDLSMAAFVVTQRGDSFLTSAGVEAYDYLCTLEEDRDSPMASEDPEISLDAGSGPRPEWHPAEARPTSEATSQPSFSQPGPILSNRTNTFRNGPSSSLAAQPSFSGRGPSNGPPKRKVPFAPGKPNLTADSKKSLAVAGHCLSNQDNSSSGLPPSSKAVCRHPTRAMSQKLLAKPSREGGRSAVARSTTGKKGSQGNANGGVVDMLGVEGDEVAGMPPSDNGTGVQRLQPVLEYIKKEDVDLLCPGEMVSGGVVAFLMVMTCVGVCKLQGLPVGQDEWTFPYILPKTKHTVTIMPPQLCVRVINSYRLAKATLRVPEFTMGGRGGGWAIFDRCDFLTSDVIAIPAQPVPRWATPEDFDVNNRGYHWILCVLVNMPTVTWRPGEVTAGKARVFLFDSLQAAVNDDQRSLLQEAFQEFIAQAATNRRDIPIRDARAIANAIPWEQVPVTQQPSEASDIQPLENGVIPGLNSCGLNAVYHFKRILEGVESKCMPVRSSRPRSHQPATAGNHTGGLHLAWVARHMAKQVSTTVMDQARGSAMRYLLAAIREHAPADLLPSADFADDERLASSFPDSMWFKRGKVPLSVEWAPRFG